MSIKTKLLSAIISVLVVTGILMGGVMYWQNTRSLTVHTYADIKNTIDYTFQMIHFYVGRVEDTVGTMAEDPLVVDALLTKDPEKVKQVSDMFTAMVGSGTIIESMALFEINGTTCINRTTSQASLSIVGKDFSDRDYCKGILKNQSIYISSAYIGSTTKNVNLALVVPVRNTKGEMIGFVSGVISTNELRGYLWDLQKESSIVLLDRYGMPFIDTKGKITALDAPVTAVVGDVQKRLAENQKEGYFQDQATFVGFKSNGVITVVYEKSAAAFFALIRTLNITVLLSLFVMIFFTTAIIYVFIGTITNRISRLSEISQKIAAGKFEVTLKEDDLTAKDETGVLARAFHDMAAKLSDLYRTMDEKVTQRTVELERSKDELEKMNAFMVDRELKLAEMKKEQYEAKK